MIDAVKRAFTFLALILSVVGGGLLVFLTLGSWGRKEEASKGGKKVVDGKATVEVKSANIEADKSRADSINSALDRLP